MTIGQRPLTTNNIFNCWQLYLTLNSRKSVKCEYSWNKLVNLGDVITLNDSHWLTGDAIASKKNFQVTKVCSVRSLYSLMYFKSGLTQLSWISIFLQEQEQDHRKRMDENIVWEFWTNHYFYYFWRFWARHSYNFSNCSNRKFLK